MSVLLDDLKNEIAKGQTIVIVGAGVSIGATKGHKCASWTGLLHDGVNHCVELGEVQPNLADALRMQIDSGDLDLLQLTAEAISSKLRAPNGGEYHHWLREAVGTLTAENKDVIEALGDLGVVLATTNYDGLLEEVTGLRPVTWMDGAIVQRVLRNEEKGILHLHGYWERPESVVLGIRSYEKVLGSEHAQTMQRAISALKSILFVGCGEGLNDPNFGSLLKWIGKVFSGAEHRHYRLVLENEAEKIRQQHAPEQRLSVVSYGQKHDELAEFLRGLKPEKGTADPLDEPPPTPTTFRLPPRPRCFGREDDLKAMVAELLADQPQPIPILGTAGIGKSTLTLAAMHDEQVAAKYSTRRYFVRCDGIKSRSSLAGEIARVIGLEPGPNSEAAVLYEFSTAPAILALDNAETPWEEDMLPVEELLENLASVPKLALIVSIRGNERPDRVQWREAFRLEELELFAARQTFLAIAGRSFEADPKLNDLLAAIDYVPLAIMLIAHASEGEPNLESVWQRWQAERTEMLKRGGAEDKSTNIQISYEFSLKSPRLTREAFRLLKLLALLPSGLAAKDLSLVMHRDGPTAASVLRKLGLIFDESRRLRLLAPLREYVRAKYEPEPFAQQRLVSHFMEMAKTLGGKVGDKGGADAIQQLTPEAFNIEEILSLELSSRTPKKAIEAIITWSEFVKNTGIGSTKLLERAVATSSSKNFLMLSAKCLFTIGEIAFLHSEYESAIAKHEEALQIYRQIGHSQGEGNCIQGLGDVANFRSDYETATARYEEALQVYRRIGHSQGEASCIASLGSVDHFRSDYETATARYEEALQIYRRIGHSQGAANCIYRLGDVANVGSDYETATARCEEALQIYRQIGDLQGEGNCIQALGTVADSRSDYETATARYEEALQICRRIGDPHGEGNCIYSLGDVANSRSDYETATARYEEALQIYRRIGHSHGEANCIHGLGNVADSRSDYETATAKYEEALQIYRRIGNSQGEAICIHSLGDVANSRSDYETATARYEEALQIFRRIGNFLGEANCFHGFGKISLSRSDYETATERFNQALTIYRKIGALRGEAECLFDMGRLALAQKDWATALSHFEQASVLFQKIDNPLWLSKTYRKLAKLTDDETERRKHLETAHSYEERLATIDLTLLLEEDAKDEG